MTYEMMKELLSKEATNRNLTDYEIYYMKEASTDAESLFHDLQSFSTNERAGICFKVILNGKSGQASTESLEESEVSRLIDSAIENATLLEGNEEEIIYAAGDIYTEIEPVKTYVPTSQELIDKVLELQEYAYKKDSHIVDGTETGISHDEMKIALFNSKGLDLTYESNFCSFFSAPTAEEGNEKFASYKFKSGCFKKVDSEELVSDAVEATVSRIGESSVKTGNYTLAFSSSMTATMLATFFTAFNGEASLKGMSQFTGKEGTSVASELVTITDDPFEEECLIHLPFDSEGVATKTKNVIEKGELKTLLYNLKAANQLGIKSTGNGLKSSYAGTSSVSPLNFFMQAGDAGTKEEIFEQIGNGIYITQLNGLHAGANPISGDFSLSSAGYMIEDGKKGRPVKNFTISGNFYEWLKNISRVGSEIEFGSPRGLSTFGAPVVTVENMPVAGE